MLKKNKTKTKTKKRGTTEAVINKYPKILPHLLQRRKSFPQRNTKGILPNCYEARSKQLSIKPILKTF